MVYSERKKKKTHLATAYKTQESSLAKRPLRDAPTDRANILLGNDSSLPVYRPALSIPNIYLYIYIYTVFFSCIVSRSSAGLFFLRGNNQRAGKVARRESCRWAAATPKCPAIIRLRRAFIYLNRRTWCSRCPIYTRRGTSAPRR